MLRKILLFSLFIFSGTNLVHGMMQQDVEQLDGAVVVSVDSTSAYSSMTLEQLGECLSNGVLNLSGGGLTWKTFSDLLPEIRTLGTFSTIEIIDLSNNNLHSAYLPLPVFLHMIHDKYLKKVVISGNPICGEGLDVLVEEIVSSLNNKSKARRLFDYLLSGIMKLAKERYELEISSEDFEIEDTKIMIDAGAHKYLLKKIVDYKPSTYFQKFSPILSKAAVAGITLFITTYGLEGILPFFMNAVEECDMEALTLMLEYCVCNATCV